MCGIRSWILSDAGTKTSVGRFPQWLNIGASKFYDWRQCYGRVNEHNGWIPRDFWLEQWEKEAIIGFPLKNLCSQVDWRMPLSRSRVGLGFYWPSFTRSNFHGLGVGTSGGASIRSSA
jgi:hypothetical protein